MLWTKHPAHQHYIKQGRPKSKTIRISDGKPMTLAVYYYACATECHIAERDSANILLELSRKWMKEALGDQQDHKLKAVVRKPAGTTGKADHP